MVLKGTSERITLLTLVGVVYRFLSTKLNCSKVRSCASNCILDITEDWDMDFATTFYVPHTYKNYICKPISEGDGLTPVILRRKKWKHFYFIQYCFYVD